MWDSYGHKQRQKQKAWQTERTKRSRGLRLPGVPVTLRYAQLNAEPLLISGFLSLIDFSPEGMHVFLDCQVYCGNEASITLEQPRQFYVKSRVVACVNYLVDTKVLCEAPLRYRVTLQFKFESDAEREEVRAFCEFVRTESLRLPKRRAA